MTRDPYILPGLPGKKTLAHNIDQGALFEAHDGKTYAYRGLLPGGRWAMYSLDSEPSPLLMPDPVTGFPSQPTHDQILEAMAAGKLHHVSGPLDTPARVRARGFERTKAEVLAADPYAEVRMLVCRKFDQERPARDDESLEKWRDSRFDWAAIQKDHGRDKPPASTLRAWISKRGRPGNRCWADMEDRRGQGPRRKRVTGHRLAIAVWHAMSHWTSRRHPSVSKLYKDVVADTNAYNLGKALIMHDGVRVWETPVTGEEIAPADPEFFRQLVKRLESRTAYKHRYSAQAAQQRWEGGGEAPEPVRFLEIVQQDETEAPTFFFIDSINRVPLGSATWVIAVCVYTRCVLAWDLSFDAPSKVSWMRNILNASKMKVLPKEWAERFPALATIGGRMSSIIYDKLPPELRALNGGEIFELALVTARIVDPTLGNPRENVWRDQPARLARALSVVPDLLCAWPDTPWRALEVVGDIRKMQPRCDALKALQRVLGGVYRSRLPASLGEQFDRVRDAITLDGITPHKHLVDLNEAAKMLGATKRTIRTARASGRLECLFALHRGEAVTAFNRVELEAIAATLDWPSAGTLTKSLGLPPYGIEQLCAMNELGWAKAPHRTMDPSLRVDPVSVKHFEDALLAGAIPVSAILQPVPLTAAMRGVGGREKAWGPVLRRLIDGEWGYAVAPDGSCVRSIIVEQKDVEAIRSVEFCMSDWSSFPFENMLNQADACDILNVPLRDRGTIEGYKVGTQRGARLYARSELASLASEVITSSELCARNLLHPKTAAAVLRRVGLTPSEFGYIRCGSAERFESELNS